MSSFRYRSNGTYDYPWGVDQFEEGVVVKRIHDLCVVCMGTASASLLSPGTQSDPTWSLGVQGVGERVNCE